MPYQYQALDPEAGYVRLMYLLPAEASADIRVALLHTRLTKEDVPKYEALSYAWGERDTPEVVYVGQEGDDTIAVTRSLYQALPYLRYREKRRVLWIDAICVDQQNLEERGHQVQRMSDVYSLAERVIVWLGLDDTTSGHTIQLLRTIASKVEVDWITSTIKPVSQDDAQWADVTGARYHNRQDRFAVYSLIIRPWFERLWVQQEIHSNTNAVLICGLDTLSWHDFRKAIYCFYRDWGAFEDEITLYPDLGVRFQLINNMICEAAYLTLGALIERTQHCKCSDPRDRVYAVLNMPNNFERNAKIKPDYTKTVNQVYQNVVLSSLNNTNKIAILGYCEMQELPLESCDSLQIPSWVPDWNFPRHTQRMVTGNASGNSNAETSNDNDVLWVSGTYVAKIDHVERIMCDNVPSLISAIQDFSQRFLSDAKSASYVSGGSKLDAYCQTLCGGYFVSKYLPASASMPVFQDSREWLSSVLSPSETGIEIDFKVATVDEPYDYVHWVWHFCNGRSLFTTEEGHIGLAPRAAKPGDRVCVLLGSDAPFLLRPTEDKQYQLVGPCYTHGIMSGEALLGPLPGDYRSVDTFDYESNAYTLAFHSTEKSIVQWNDPRLPYEPVYELSGARVGWLEEERRVLTSEALKKRGVHMEIFELI